MFKVRLSLTRTQKLDLGKRNGGATGKEAGGVERSGCSIILIKVRDRLMKKCHADVNFLFLQGDVGAAYSRGGAGQL